MSKLFLNLIFLSCFLVSCDQGESSKDINYYLKNSEEREKKITQCEGEFLEKIFKIKKEGRSEPDAKELDESQSCKNAKEASKKAVEIKYQEEKRIAFDKRVDQFLNDDKKRKDELEYCRKFNKSLSIIGGSTDCKAALQAEEIKKGTSKKNK